MPTEQFGLDQAFMDQLEQEAERRGMTPEALAAELIRSELANRTKPRNPRGTVAPFHRRA
jgi:predicted DNA-binding ribbon-helix-helix protein